MPLLRTIGYAGLGTVGVLLVAASGLLLADSLYTKSCEVTARVGQVIEIPGERMTVLDPGPGGAGEVLAFDTVRDPNDPKFELRYEDGHLHPYQEERFEIIEGRARFLIGRDLREVGPGDVAVVPPNTMHNWMALDGVPVHVLAEYRPALDTGEWFVSFHGALERGEMDLLQAAVIQSEFRKGAPWPASPPPIVAKLLFKSLAPVGRLLGYRAC